MPITNSPVKALKKPLLRPISNPAVLPLKVREFLIPVRDNWRKAAHSILEVANICCKARRDLSGKEFRLFARNLPFKQPTLSKLEAIGNDDRLKRPEMLENLPPSYSMMYAASQLDDCALQDAVSKKIIHPGMRRATFAQLRTPQRRARASNAHQLAVSNAPQRPHAQIFLSEAVSTETQAGIDDTLRRLMSEPGVKVIWSTEIVRTVTA